MATTAPTSALTPEREAVWLGILQAHTEVTKAVDHALVKRHDLTLSAYEVLSRLARAEDGHQRMSDLAGCSPLSLSRVSRVIDALQARGLVVRVSCSKDSRVVYAAATDAGTELAAAAAQTFAEVLEGQYLGRLSCEEIGQLGTLLGRLAAPRDDCG